MRRKPREHYENHPPVSLTLVLHHLPEENLIVGTAGDGNPSEASNMREIVSAIREDELPEMAMDRVLREQIASQDTYSFLLLYSNQSDFRKFVHSYKKRVEILGADIFRLVLKDGDHPHKEGFARYLAEAERLENETRNAYSQTG